MQREWSCLVRFASFVFKIRQMFRPADKPAWSRSGY